MPLEDIELVDEDAAVERCRRVRSVERCRIRSKTTFVAGAGLAVYSVGSLPPEKQSTPTATQLAARLAESVDPFCFSPAANSRRNSKRIGGAALNHSG